MPAPVATLDEMLEILRQRGDRITMARRAVLEELIDAPDSHLSADALAERIHRRYPDIHLSTVYRTVEFLTQAGLLTEVHVGHGPSSYHFAADSHHHAVCDRCGREVELPADLFEPVTSRLRRDYGFEADPSHLTISGRCADCQAEVDADPRPPAAAHSHPHS
jgi:Fe2+ or Zn2+ uptake regulation protein